MLFALWSNCRLYAWWRYRHMHREWVRAGMPRGREPYRWKRPSRLNPRWITHHGVGWRDSASDMMALESFVPRENVDLPWWRLWQCLLFPGRVVRGDRPPPPAARTRPAGRETAPQRRR